MGKRRFRFGLLGIMGHWSFQHTISDGLRVSLKSKSLFPVSCRQNLGGLVRHSSYSTRKAINNKNKYATSNFTRNNNGNLFDSVARSPSNCWHALLRLQPAFQGSINQPSTINSCLEQVKILCLMFSSCQPI